jgi:hypothetical protein
MSRKARPFFGLKRPRRNDFCLHTTKILQKRDFPQNVLKQFKSAFPEVFARSKIKAFWAFPSIWKFIFLSCGILLHFRFRYASLAPVSQRENPRKYLINKYLKQHFKYQKVFHRLWKTCGKPSSKESEKKFKRVLLQHFPLLGSKQSLRRPIVGIARF